MIDKPEVFIQKVIDEGRRLIRHPVMGCTDHGANYRDGDDWHCLMCNEVWPVASDPEGHGPVVTPVSTVRTMSKPVMVMRSLRVPLKLWEAAKVKADEREENISDVLRDALERYVKRK